MEYSVFRLFRYFMKEVVGMRNIPNFTELENMWNTEYSGLYETDIGAEQYFEIHFYLIFSKNRFPYLIKEALSVSHILQNIAVLSL